MPLPRCSGSFSRAVAFAPLSSRLVNFTPSDPPRLAACFPGRYTAVCAAFIMGWVDCSRRDNYPGYLRSRHLCYAPDSGQSQGSEEAHCGERRNEWTKLLQSPKYRCCRPERSKADCTRGKGNFRPCVSKPRIWAYVCHLPHEHTGKRRRPYTFEQAKRPDYPGQYVPIADSRRSSAL